MTYIYTFKVKFSVWKSAVFQAAVLFFGASGVAQAQVHSPSHGDCAALQGLQLDRAAIGLPTKGATVATTTLIAAGQDDAGLCVVEGKIASIDPSAPPINFIINLPASWNRKAVQMGGGGYDGFIATVRNHPLLPPSGDPVRLGYVTFGSDSGHKGANQASAVADASFAMNAEARENFAYTQIKKTHDTAISIIEHYYGNNPTRTYFYGNSQGGHEAMLAAQRFPDDYDGVVAIHPAYNFTALQLGGLAVSKALFREPGAWLDQTALTTLGQGVLKACDDLDGLRDGIIANVAQCKRAFDLQSLACPPGRTKRNVSVSCLQPAQLRALRAIAVPANLGMIVSGADTFGGWPVLEGAYTYPSPFGFGKNPAPSTPPGRDDAFLYVMADQGIRFLVAQEPELKSLDFDAAAHAAMVERAYKLTDVDTPDFDRFRAHGGKILMMHGSVDMAIPPANSIALFGRLNERYGHKLSEFLKFYIAYGFGHVEGAFQLEWDSLAELDRWVETGKQPDAQTIRDRSGPKAGRTMPLCEYPAWPRYSGQGDPAAASSFSCHLDTQP